ncbi:MAG: ABC transporter ATP-binding protein [Clostridia bacterium]|nr:ABC transporter ATP-binding protein [Clostridia bacterium]
MNAILRVERLNKRFGGVHAVRDCSFDVREGTITGLIGPNGSGKTTVFNLITGMIPADGGRVVFAGQPIEHLPRWERAHRGLARTFQITRLFRDMTVLENVVAPLDRFSWRALVRSAVSGAERRRALELLDFVGLAGLAHRRAGELSYGQQKLVEFAQVLMQDPKLILLDEPAGGVNPAMIDRMAGLVKELNRRGTTFLIVEHNMPMVMSLCNPVIVLARGSKIAEGSPKAVQDNPAVLEAYLGDSAPPSQGSAS